MKEVYVPLIPRLKATLAEASQAVTFPPFNVFLGNLIQIYLDRMLESKDSVPPLTTPSVACSPNTCEDCKLLDQFLNNTEPKISFRMNQQRRQHLEYRIRGNRRAESIVTTMAITSGGPHTLIVHKKPEVLERYTWTGRQAAAKAFLRSIGDDGVLLAIMGQEKFYSTFQTLEPPTVYA